MRIKLVAVYSAALLLLVCLLAGCAGSVSADEPSVTYDGRVTAVSRTPDTDLDLTLRRPAEFTGTAVPVQSVPSASGDFSLRFIAAGDNIIHENVYIDAASRAGEGEEYSFVSMYDDIAELVSSADIAFVNQETPVCGRELGGYSGYPNFNSPPETVDALLELGFDIVNIANNHMLDKREEGLLNFIDFMETKDVLLLGAYRDAADYDNIRVYETNGIKIAFLSYTYSTNGMTLNKGSKHIIPLINEKDITRQVSLAKEAGDLVFVSIHWGTEDQFTPDASQKKYSQLMSDLGVDVIIGHHPHVAGPVKWLSGAGGNKTLCIYSLGNLISTMLYPQNMVGGIAGFDIVRRDGVLSIENPVYTPIVCHYDITRLNLQVYLMENYTEELCKAHGAQKRGAFTLNRLKRYITDTIDAEFMPEWLIG